MENDAITSEDFVYIKKLFVADIPEWMSIEFNQRVGMFTRRQYHTIKVYKHVGDDKIGVFCTYSQTALLSWAKKYNDALTHYENCGLLYPKFKGANDIESAVAYLRILCLEGGNDILFVEHTEENTGILYMGEKTTRIEEFSDPQHMIGFAHGFLYGINVES